VFALDGWASRNAVVAADKLMADGLLLIALL
jgi:hypothetical protein